MKKILIFVLSIGVIAAIVAVYFLYIKPSPGSSRSKYVIQWIRSPQEHQDWAVSAGERCGDAPFVMPTSGLIGYLWDDSFRPGHRHQGIDIFGGAEAGVVEVYAAADGYLTRETGWKSTVIMRIPSDPLHPGQQIWTYYTHMADSSGESLISDAFPPGTSEVFVKAGTLLGRQGNYSGTPDNPTGVHLHFSIVRDDGSGRYRNELEIGNTLDPSPYLGLGLNAKGEVEMPVLCRP